MFNQKVKKNSKKSTLFEDDVQDISKEKGKAKCKQQQH